MATDYVKQSLSSFVGDFNLALSKQLNWFRQMWHCDTSTSLGALTKAQGFYVHRMDTFINRNDNKYIKYRQLKGHHRRALEDARTKYNIPMEETALETFARKLFSYYLSNNNVKYNGCFLPPSSRIGIRPDLTIKLLRLLRVW